MIKLPPNTHPSELLYLEDRSHFVAQLLKTSRLLRLEGKWKEAEQSARRALEASQEPGAQVSRGAALIHLVDVHLAVGRLGIALKQARSAHRLFSAQPSRYQRHNEAIAAYALGLAHQSLGSQLEALKWYQKCSVLLERARIDWTTNKARSRATSCRRLQRWIDALNEGLMNTEAPAFDHGPARLWLPFLPPGSESGFALAPLQVERYLVATAVEVAGQTFRIELLDGPSRPSLQAEADHYALRVPEHALSLLDADDGDYALIVRQNTVDREGPGVLETLSGVEFGHFQRDEAGHITFARPDATVIGGDDIGEDFTVGYVTALLKRI